LSKKKYCILNIKKKTIFEYIHCIELVFVAGKRVLAQPSMLLLGWTQKVQSCVLLLVSLTSSAKLSTKWRTKSYISGAL